MATGVPRQKKPGETGTEVTPASVLGKAPREDKAFKASPGPPGPWGRPWTSVLVPQPVRTWDSRVLEPESPERRLIKMPVPGLPWVSGPAPEGKVENFLFQFHIQVKNQCPGSNGIQCYHGDPRLTKLMEKQRKLRKMLPAPVLACRTSETHSPVFLFPIGHPQVCPPFSATLSPKKSPFVVENEVSRSGDGQRLQGSWAQAPASWSRFHL